MTFFYTYQNHTFQMYHYVSFNMALFSLLFPWHSRFFFEGFSLNIVFFTQGSKVLFFKCIIMCPLKYFSCPLGYICFGSNINSFQHASNTQGRKNIQRKIFVSFFPKFFCFPLELFSWFCNTHMFPKTENGTYKGAFWTNTHRDSEVDF